MQPTNKPSQHKSRCSFCSSTDYGKGCRFGPGGVHMHTDNPSRCSYCGSSDYGKGCKLNPSGNIHIRGAVYNNMYKETVQSFLDSKILINEIKKPYTEFQCYKLGIIDEKGNKTRNPSTIQEHAAYDSMTRTILKLKRFLGPKIDLIDAFTEMQTNIKLVNENLEYFNKIIEYKQRVDEVTENLYKIINEAQRDGIPLNELKSFIKA